MIASDSDAANICGSTQKYFFDRLKKRMALGQPLDIGYKALPRHEASWIWFVAM